jgi:hypothetical protein
MTVNALDGCLIPGDNYPSWLTFNSKGSSVIFAVPQVKGRNLKTMMCFVYSSSPDNITSYGLNNVLVINHTKTTIKLYKKEAFSSFQNGDWQRVLSNMEPGDKVEIVVVFGNNFVVLKTAVYLIYDEPIDEKLEQCHSPDKNFVVDSGDENESGSKSISLQVEPADDFKLKQKRSVGLVHSQSGTHADYIRKETKHRKRNKSKNKCVMCWIWILSCVSGVQF